MSEFCLCEFIETENKKNLRNTLSTFLTNNYNKQFK